MEELVCWSQVRAAGTRIFVTNRLAYLSFVYTVRYHSTILLIGTFLFCIPGTGYAGYRVYRVPSIPGTGYAGYRVCRVPGMSFDEIDVNHPASVQCIHPRLFWIQHSQWKYVIHKKRPTAKNK